MKGLRDRVLNVFLVVGIFYFGFMNLDRLLSLVYGFNFQPYGEYVPRGFTYWGHIGNGSLAALGLYITFKLEETGLARENKIIQYSGYAFYAFIGAYIPYMNDVDHLFRHGAGNTSILYLIANDIYVFLMGWTAYKTCNTVKKKAIAVILLAFAFLVIHFLLYAPSFPEFYWS